MSNINSSNLAFATCLEHPGLVSSGADSILGHEYLLTEILVRVPAKSLVKFKSVSKHWKYLISSPHFSLLHFLHNSRDSIPVSGIFLRTRCVPSPYSYCFLSVTNLDVCPPSFSVASTSTIEIPGLVVSILQSCNGLLLYYSISSSDSKVLNLHVYNPTTGQLRTIPSIQNSFVSAALAFDSHNSSHSYKVISVHATMLPDHYALKIYSSVTGCWKDLDGDYIRVPHNMSLRNGVFWRGAVHWVCRSEGSLYLNVDEGRVMKMPSPLISGSERGDMKCLECKGKLWYLWHKCSDMSLEVHVMDSYEEGWLRKFTVNLGVLRKETLMGGYYSGLAILSLLNSRKCHGGEGCMMVIIHVPGKILGFDLKNGTIKEMCKLPLIEGEDARESQFHCFDAYPYSYSLACV